MTGVAHGPYLPEATGADGDRIRCPWCGELLAAGLYKFNLGNGDAVTVGCDYCEHTSNISCCISVDYYAAPMVKQVPR